MILSTQIATTEAVFAHHLQEIFARNVDGIMIDYIEESVLFVPQGVFMGLTQIRGFFDAAFDTLLTPEVLAAAQVLRQDVDGEYAYLLWAAPPTILIASDTFHVRDGKIVMQSFAGYLPS
jgi:ketosteroid isomerase-like protein